jgi:dipeptidyl aminopeptidase/acylaminoacyl peptidase
MPEDQTYSFLLQQRFRASSLAWAQLARQAPDYGLVSINASGVHQLYAWKTATGELKQLTDHTVGVGTGLISPDGRYVYYLDDQTGKELGHIVRVPFSGGVPQDITPGLPPYPTFGLTINQSNSMLAFITANKEGFQLWVIPLDADGKTGLPRLLYSNNALLMQPSFSTNGQAIVLTTNERTGKQQLGLLALDTATGNLLGELRDKPGSSVAGSIFSPVADAMHIITACNSSGAYRPLIWKPLTGERIDLALDGIKGDITAYDWSPDGERILLGQSRNATQQLFIYNLLNASLTPLPDPGGTFGSAFFGPDGSVWCQWNDASHVPGLISLITSPEASTRPVLVLENALPSSSLQSVTFPASDGQLVQGWIGVPGEQGPFPTILHIHGGPFSAATDAFDPETQSWLEHGFAFMSINYRGSTTFGRDFQMQILGRPGYWEVEDIVAARAWLLEEGISQSDQVFVTGWSYGGYLTLQALGTYPTLWAGGMAGAAIVDWSMQYEDTPDTFKAYTALLFGGIPEQKAEQYSQSSPLTFLHQLTAPTLIIQGENDTRCPPRQMQTYYAQAQQAGKEIYLHWYDAGHKSRSVDERIAHHTTMLTFAQRVLKRSL